MQTKAKWSQSSRQIVLVAFWAYATGVGIWLAIGCTPWLAQYSGLFRQGLERAAIDHPTWARVIDRILNNPMMGSSADSVLEYLFSALNVALGLLLVTRKRNETVPLLLAFALLGTAATFNMPSHVVFRIIGSPLPIAILHFTFHIVSGVTYMWAVVVFPNGRLPKKFPIGTATSRLLLVAATVETGLVSWRGSFINHPEFFAVFFGVLVPVTGIVSQSFRVVNEDDVVMVQQARLLRAALTPALVLGVVWLISWVGGHLGIVPAITAANFRIQVENLFPAVFALVPVMLFVAVHRLHLWEIDTVLSRALLYALVGGVLGIAYVTIVTVLGTLIGDGLTSTLIAISIVGMAAEAVRVRAKQIVNRLVFGQDVRPADAMRTLTDDLERLSARDELRELTETAVKATRASRAIVWLIVERELVPIAVFPRPNKGKPPPRRRLQTVDVAGCTNAIAAPVCVPVDHQGKLLGMLAIDLPPGVSLPRQENHLLTEMAGHAGLLVRNVQLTTALAHHVARVSAQTQELKRARKRVASAHEAERRRLERNLHDGAQQELVALLVNLRTVESQISVSGEEGDLAWAIDELDRLQDLLVSMNQTLYELCAGDVPHILVERGLQGAIEASAAIARTTGASVDVTFESVEEPPLDVVTAVYFCCVEALQNSLKHAKASLISVKVKTEMTFVDFDVTDDGAGFDPTSVTSHSGLDHMMLRLAAVGATVAVESAAGHGTRISGHIPLKGFADSASALPPAFASRRPVRSGDPVNSPRQHERIDNS